MHLLFFVFNFSPGISIHVVRSTNDTPVAGQPLSFTCLAELRDNVTQSPLTLSWLCPLDNSLPSSSHYHTLTNGTFNTSLAIVELQWPAVNLSQAGSYTCQAELQTGERVTVTEDLVLQGNKWSILLALQKQILDSTRYLYLYLCYSGTSLRQTLLGPTKLSII